MWIDNQLKNVRNNRKEKNFKMQDWKRKVKNVWLGVSDPDQNKKNKTKRGSSHLRTKIFIFIKTVENEINFNLARYWI